MEAAEELGVKDVRFLGYDDTIVLPKVEIILEITDVILEVNGGEINFPQDIIRIIDEGLHKVGDLVILTILRDNNMIKLKLVLEEPKSEWWGF